ncbi:hypothetical protein FKM82_026101 [Ascaphus truei]
MKKNSIRFQVFYKAHSYSILIHKNGTTTRLLPPVRGFLNHIQQCASIVTKSDIIYRNPSICRSPPDDKVYFLRKNKSITVMVGSN